MPRKKSNSQPQTHLDNHGNVTTAVGKIRPPKSAKNVTVKEETSGTVPKRHIANETPAQRRLGSVGRYTEMQGNDLVQSFSGRLAEIRRQAMGTKQAGFFPDGNLGIADITDSQNIGYYSFEFPVDALELPASRAEELRFYRLAYDRDPIVARAIDLHTELPLSKITWEKPRCGSQDFADYVFDEFQAWAEKTRFFQTLIDAVREYWTIGEAFLFVEDESGVELCSAAKKALEKPGGNGGPGTEPMTEAENAQIDAMDQGWLIPGGTGGIGQKTSSLNDEAVLDRAISSMRRRLNLKLREHAKAARASGYAFGIKLAAPPAPAATTPVEPAATTTTTAPAPAANAPDAAPAVSGDAAPAGNGGDAAPAGNAGLEGVEFPVDQQGGVGAASTMPIPPGGGVGAGMPSAGGGNPVAEAIQIGTEVERKREIAELRHLLRLLTRQKELLQKYREMHKERKAEEELFLHIENKEYDGPKRIQILPPEQIELSAEGTAQGFNGPTVYYKPPDSQRQAYMEDPDTPKAIKDMIAEGGKLPLNTDPLAGGSYCIHFARKKAGYELHGRSILQRVLRTIIYREKLRQVQTTLASRNMTPKTLVVAPEVSVAELMALRAHVDEAKADPDYTIVVNYECTWNEIGAEGRLLALGDEWTHTNSDLAIGLGFSPEILIGEGLYGSNRVQLEMMNTSYMAFREVLSEIVERDILKPIAMRRGFYEEDRFGRPRWIYPKVTFGRMALRDSADVFDAMYNLYAKGSLPVQVLLDFMNIDEESARRQLEDNMFTVNDSKQNEMLTALYNSLPDHLIQKSNVLKKVITGLKLDQVDSDAKANQQQEGSGEGM